MNDDADTSMESLGGDRNFRGGGVIWSSTQTGTETINDILKYSNRSAQRLGGASAGPQVEHSSGNPSLLKDSSSSVPYFYTASPNSISPFGSVSVGTQPSIRAKSGSTSTNGSSSPCFPGYTTCSTTSSLKPRSNGSSADLKRIRPSQRRAFLGAAATTEASTSSRGSIEEERVNQYHTHNQVTAGVGTQMHPIDNLDTLHRMLQSVSKSWSASNADSSTTGTRSSKPPSRVVTPIPSTSETLQPKGSRKAHLSSLENDTALQPTSTRSAFLPSRSTLALTQTIAAGVDVIENPLKEAVAKFESPVRTRPRKSIGNSGNNLMPPPPPPLKPLPSKQRPHLSPTSACDLSAPDMSFELEATGSQIESPCKPEDELEQSHRPVENADVKDAEASYDDLSFVDVDGLMDVDLDDRSSSSPAVEQHVLCTTQDSITVPLPPPVLSSEPQKLSVASAMQGSQHSKPVIKRETFSSIFSTPIQVAPCAPSVSATKALGMRRAHSGPVSGYKESNISASISGAKPGTVPPYSHPSSRGPKPFKVPWARNGSSVTAIEPPAVPDIRKPAPKRRGVMDLDTSAESSFSFDDMDPEEVERLLSQIGA